MLARGVKAPVVAPGPACTTAAARLFPPQMHIVGKRGTKLLETSDTPDDAVLAETVRQWDSFEELVEWSGMLSDRPPVPAGVTGHTSYITQVCWVMWSLVRGAAVGRTLSLGVLGACFRAG